MSEREAEAEGVAARLAAVRARVVAAARRAGRDPAAVGIVAVSKTVKVERVRAAYLAGQRLFGENRVQEAEEKVRAWAAAWPDERPSWHLVGHLQTNKARAAAGLFDLIHSLDSVRLAEELDRRARAVGRQVHCLLEVHLTDEPTKQGFPPDELVGAVERLVGLPGLRVAGLMTIAPLGTPGEAARPYFRRLRALRDELAAAYPALSWQHLSMGMTDDFEVAVEEGSTLVRVGRAIFGERA